MKKTLILILLALSLLMPSCQKQTGGAETTGSAEETKKSETTKSASETEKTKMINTGIERNEINLRIYPDKTKQTIKYMGASGCWVGRAVETLSDRDLRDCVEMLYGENGIGMTSYRYNIGGGEPMSNANSRVKTTTCIEISPGSRTYNIKRDAASLKVMDLAIENGAKYVTLFVNSPPAYMTYSGYTAGNTDGTSNLRPEYYDEFVNYVVDITEEYLKAGYPVIYVSPINEPSGNWGQLSANQVWQEGCHYEIEEILKIDLMVAKELKKRNLDVKVSFPETAQWSTACFSTELLKRIADDKELLPYIDHFCCHSYSADLSMRRGFMNVLKSTGLDIPLHQSEWCSGETGIKGVMELANVIHDDFTVLNCETWEFWVSFMVDDYSFIKVSNGNYTINKRMWAMGNYSKFIQGSTRCDTVCVIDDVKASAYVSPDKNEIYLIVINNSDEKRKMCLDGFDGLKIDVWETSEYNNLKMTGNIDSTYGYMLKAESVTTFVIHTEGK